MAVRRSREALVVGEDSSEVASQRQRRREMNRIQAKIGAPALKAPVEELMTRKVLTCTPDDSITYLMKLMTEKRIRHVPVVDGALAGIISIGDVVKNRLEELELETDVLRDAYRLGSGPPP